jgi:hypothetical protein
MLFLVVTMTFAIIQVAFTCILLVYCGIWRRAQAKRRLQSLDDAMARLDQASLRSISGCSSEDLWVQIGGARGLWALYRQVPLLIAIADYVDSSKHEGNEELLTNLRADALQIRISVIFILFSYALMYSKARIAGRLESVVEAYQVLLASTSEAVGAHSTALAPALC